MHACKEKDNPFMSSETCKAYREGIANELRAVRSEIVESRRFVEEKIKTIKTSIAVGFTVSTLVIAVVQFLLNLQG